MKVCKYNGFWYLFNIKRFFRENRKILVKIIPSLKGKKNSIFDAWRKKNIQTKSQIMPLI